MLEARGIGAGATANPQVAVVQRRRLQPDDDFVGRGAGILHFLEREVLGSAGLMEDDGSHGRFSFAS